MRRSWLIALCVAVLALPASAGWDFGQAIAVTEAARPGVFHHLDSAGRKNVALSGDRVGVAWEDNRSGQPGIYYSSMHPDQGVFSESLRISSGNEAYEPVITPLDNGRFVLVWEQDGAVWTRSVTEFGLGAALKLSSGAAGHASAASWKGRVYAVWREQRETESGLRFSRLTLDMAGNIKSDESRPIEKGISDAPQLYPSIAAGEAGIVIAWEDRRAGHTRLLLSYSADAETFMQPEELNEYFHNRNEYDKGNGVTRVALAGFGKDEVLAAWMDKRRGGKGYAIYAALATGGGKAFGPNERVQGDQGDALPHYNPAVAGNSDGAFVVAWDDYRNGTSDIWLSSYSDELEWGDDFTLSAAAGAGEQSNPAVTMGSDGTIHLVWIERSALGQPTRIWYAAGTPRAD